ncbi:hypothetical protein [Flavobacterium sp. LM5]|uniref:hypothetical protein n=1 Tax=Flavobacterium sp. LM5 TaxID=1938610 RepID=UPI0021013EE4|nr:hypothetical protein [Flavobacterium sp. LM5]
MLREYYKAYQPTNYLFEGQSKGQPYDARSLQLILKQALRKTAIPKPLLYIGCATVLPLIY